jgi:hypothetical protein
MYRKAQKCIGRISTNYYYYSKWLLFHYCGFHYNVAIQVNIYYSPMISFMVSPPFISTSDVDCTSTTSPFGITLN